jgi:hypothetical protein
MQVLELHRIQGAEGKHMIEPTIEFSSPRSHDATELFDSMPRKRAIHIAKIIVCEALNDIILTQMPPEIICNNFPILPMLAESNNSPVGQLLLRSIKVTTKYPMVFHVPS